MTEPPTDEQQQAIIPLPYDLAWDAVNQVVKANGFRTEVDDPNYGVIQASGSRFTLHDADCGKVTGVGGSYSAEPEPGASSVYNFLVRPRGPEKTLVEVRATFNSAVKVPLSPAQDVDCVSHGIQELNLLRQVLAQAKQTHRPVVSQQQTAATAPPATAPTINQASIKNGLQGGRSTIERSGAESPPAAAEQPASAESSSNAEQPEASPSPGTANPLGTHHPSLIGPGLPPMPKL